MELAWASITSAQTPRLQLRFWVNKKILGGAIQPPTQAGVGRWTRPIYFCTKAVSGNQRGPPTLLFLRPPRLPRRPPASGGWGQGGPPDQGRVCTGCGVPGVRVAMSLQLCCPCLVTCSLACFLGRRQQKKLKMGDGQQMWRKAGHLWAGLRHSPRVPGSVRLSSQALEALAQDTDRDSWGRPWGVG